MTPEEVQQIYDYLHETYEYKDGNLLRKDNKKILMGTVCGNTKKLLFTVSFRTGKVKRNWPYSHLIYMYHHKIKPDYLININGNPVDYRIENLRAVNHSKMMQECDLRVKNKHGFKGVFQDNKRFAARLWMGKSYKYISWHQTPEEAHAAYLKAKEEYKNEK
jgi:hypothetical protein